MKRIYVCSPYSGDTETNTANARRYGQYVMGYGHAPFIPHLLYTQWLDDSKPADREAGLQAGNAFREVCDELWIFYPPSGDLSPGMQRELDAWPHKKPVKHHLWGAFEWQKNGVLPPAEFPWVGAYKSYPCTKEQAEYAEAVFEAIADAKKNELLGREVEG